MVSFSLSLSLSSIHPPPLQIILTSRWNVDQSGKYDTPHVFLWICHFTYRRLTSQYRHNERGNGAIIPVSFRGGTVITHLSICCHQRIECDCVSGRERQKESMQVNMLVCECVLHNFVYACVPRLCILFQGRNVTPGALTPRVEKRKISQDVFYTAPVIQAQEVFQGLFSDHCR